MRGCARARSKARTGRDSAPSLHSSLAAGFAATPAQQMRACFVQEGVLEITWAHAFKGERSEEAGGAPWEQQVRVSRHRTRVFLAQAPPGQAHLEMTLGNVRIIYLP